MRQWRGFAVVNHAAYSDLAILAPLRGLIIGLAFLGFWSRRSRHPKLLPAARFAGQSHASIALTSMGVVKVFVTTGSLPMRRGNLDTEFWGGRFRLLIKHEKLSTANARNSPSIFVGRETDCKTMQEHKEGRRDELSTHKKTVVEEEFSPTTADFVTVPIRLLPDG